MKERFAMLKHLQTTEKQEELSLVNPAACET